MNTNKKSSPLYTITAGPSRDRLIDAFKYSYEKSANLGLRLHLEPLSQELAKAGHAGYECTHVHITTIAHEDGSGQSFIFSGWACVDLGDGSRNYGFDAYYDARSRRGHVSFAE